MSQHRKWVHQFADGRVVTMHDPEGSGVTPCTSNNHAFCTVPCACECHEEGTK